MPSPMIPVAALPTPASAPRTGSANTEPAAPGRNRGFAQALDQARDGKPTQSEAEGGPAGAPASSGDGCEAPTALEASAQAGSPADGTTDGAPTVTDAPAPAATNVAALLAQWQGRPAEGTGSATEAAWPGDAEEGFPGKAGNASGGLASLTAGHTGPAASALPAGPAAAGPGGFAAQMAAQKAESALAVDSKTPKAELPAASGKPGETAALPLPTLLQAPPAAPAATAAAPVEVRLPSGPASADFGAQLGAQVTTFVRNGIEHARLHLNPEDMGPVQVRIQIDGSTASVQFSADQAPTRQALEQALPLLAGSLREAGLTLSGGGVFQQARQGGRPGAEAATGGTGRGGVDAPDAVERSLPAVRTRGVVDLVA